MWEAELQRTLAALGEDPRDWMLVQSDEHWGKDYPASKIASVSPDVPCETVSSVVQHEWMHLQQARWYGVDFGRSVLGDGRVEIIANCGAWLLGSTYTPYRQKLLDDHGVPSSTRDLGDARELIGNAGQLHAETPVMTADRGVP